MGRTFKSIVGMCLLAGIVFFAAYRAGFFRHGSDTSLFTTQRSSIVPAVTSVPSAVSGAPQVIEAKSKTDDTAQAQKPSSATGSDVDDASTSVAIRFDQTRVLFLVSDERSEFNLDEAHTKRLRSLGEPIAEYGGGPLFEPDDELLKNQQNLFDRAHIGEEWQLQVSADSQIPVVIKQQVALEEGCSARVGFLAQLPSPNQPDFGAASAKYFLISKTSAIANQGLEKPARIGRLPDWKATPDLRVQLEQLLQARMKDEIAKVHTESVPEYERAVSGDATWKPWSERWKRFDEMLARGEGKLDYDVEAFQLTPDGAPRLYVRAKWTIEKKSAFLMSAWLRAQPTPVFESVNANESRAIRMPELVDTDSDISALGTVLNVFDRNHDDHGELLIYSPGYESFDIHLFRYTDSGPVPTAISLSGGC